MTEHTASPEPIAKISGASDERIAHWVDTHIPYNGQFRSPDSPPSVVEEIERASHHSDEDSSHSLPPKMVLKYSDGRGEPISHWHYDPHYPHYRGPAPRSRPQTPHQRSKSAIGHRPPPPIYPVDHGHPLAPEELDYDSAPEDIQILPADPSAQPQRVTGSYRPRRLSEPFRGHPPPPPTRDADVYDSPPPRYVTQTLNVPASVTHSHPQHIRDPYNHHHPNHSYSRGNRPPPSIVYNYHNTDHFTPPTIVHAPPKAPGLNRTGSSPNGFPQYPRITTKPYPPVHSQLGLPEEKRYGPRGPRPREDTLRASPISKSTSGSSNSTYYVLPNAGQKIKVLVSPQPNALFPLLRLTCTLSQNGPEPSLYNGSSAKSPSLPRTPDSATTFGFKRPLFSRFFSFSRKDFQRRHSIDVPRSQSRDRR